MKLIQHLLQVFFPFLCISCDQHLIKGEKTLCTKCRLDLPFVENGNYTNNQVTTIFKGRVLIEYGASFLYFRKEGVTKKLIHQLKYKGQQEIGLFLGEWLGKQLKNEEFVKTIDCIVPVPLHKRKQLKRGYNQLTRFGEALSQELNIPYTPNILQRINHTNTQTFKTRFERFQSKNSKFIIPDTSKFKDQHILLIDDVITTGATLESCCKELLKTQNIKISILTIALTE